MTRFLSRKQLVDLAGWLAYTPRIFDYRRTLAASAIEFQFRARGFPELSFFASFSKVFFYTFTAVRPGSTFHARDSRDRAVVAGVLPYVPAAFESENIIHRPVEKVAVVADHDKGPSEIVEIFLERDKSGDVEIIGRLIEQQNIRRAHQNSEQV